MPNFTIERVVREINKELVPEFEAKLRRYLRRQDKDWLIDQIVRLTLDKHSLHEHDMKVYQRIKAEQREKRAARVQKMGLDEEKLDKFIADFDGMSRRKLKKEEYLLKAPPKGTALITKEHRTHKGALLLTKAKDILFALLFGDSETNVNLTRTSQELLTMTLPRYKSAALDFMKATTEIGGLGTWQDPDSVSNDDRAENVILQVEYGEIDSEKVGDAILVALALINNLEVNEQILYVRMIDVEQSSLIT